MPVTPTPLAGLGSGTARLTETIVLTPGNLTAPATARRAISRQPPRPPLKITLTPRSHRSPRPLPIDQGQVGVVWSAGAVLVRRTGLRRARTRRGKHRDRLPD